MHFRIISAILSFLLVLECFFLAPASGQSRPVQLIFTPQWMAQCQFAGYIVGEKKGFYKEEGIDLQIRYPYPTNYIYSYLAEEKAQIITMNLVQAMLERSKGSRIVNIMQTSQQSGLLIVAKKPLNGLRSLVGMRIGRWRAGHSELIDIIMKEGNVHLDWAYFNSGVNLYLSGAVEATTAMTYNEYIRLLEAGQRIKENQLIRFADIGYNIPDDGVYVTETFFKNNKSLIKRFHSASCKSWEWTRAHPKEALEMVMQVMREHHLPCNRFHQELMLKEILRLQVKQGETQAGYVLSENDFHLVNVLLIKGGFLRNPLSYSEFKPKL